MNVSPLHQTRMQRWPFGLYPPKQKVSWAQMNFSQPMKWWDWKPSIKWKRYVNQWPMWKWWIRVHFLIAQPIQKVKLQRTLWAKVGRPSVISAMKKRRTRRAKRVYIYALELKIRAPNVSILHVQIPNLRRCVWKRPCWPPAIYVEFLKLEMMWYGI